MDEFARAGNCCQLYNLFLSFSFPEIRAKAPFCSDLRQAMLFASSSNPNFAPVIRKTNGGYSHVHRISLKFENGQDEIYCQARISGEINRGLMIFITEFLHKANKLGL